MRVREDYRTLTGPEKAAIFLLSLGEDYTAKVFEHMDEDEIMEISQTMANLGRVSSNVVERLFVEFAEQLRARGMTVAEAAVQIANEHETPFFLTDAAALEASASALAAVFPDPWLRAYSLKADPEPSVVRTVKIKYASLFPATA